MRLLTKWVVENCAFISDKLEGFFSRYITGYNLVASQLNFLNITFILTLVTYKLFHKFNRSSALKSGFRVNICYHQLLSVEFDRLWQLGRVSQNTLGTFFAIYYKRILKFAFLS